MRADAPAFAALLATLLLLPIAKTIGPGLLGRMTLADLGVFATAAATLVALRPGKGGRSTEAAAAIASRRIPLPLAAGLALFLAFACLSFPNTESARDSFVEMGAYAANVLLFAVLLALVRTKKRLLRCFAWWEAGAAVAIAGGVAGIAFVVAGVFETPLTSGPFVTSTFPRSGQLASFLLASFPILVFQRVHRSPSAAARRARSVFLVAAVAVLVATASRSGLAIAAGLGVFVVLAAVLRGSVRLRAATALRAGALLLVAGGAGAFLQGRTDSLPFAARRALSIASPPSFSLDRLSPARAAQWTGWQVAASQQLVTGIGPGGYQHRATSYAPAAFRPHEIHNTFLGVWAETGLGGLFGLALFVGSLATAGVRAIRDARDPTLRAASIALVLAVVAIGCYGLFHFGLRMRALWAAQGLLVAAWNLTRDA